MKHNVYIYILIMALVTYLIRTIPLVALRGEIKNKFIKSFLCYVPYVTLSAMTFPAIMTATQSPVSAFAGFVSAIVSALFGRSLFTVATVACAAVFLCELIIV